MEVESCLTVQIQLTIEQIESISNADNGQDNKIIPKQYLTTIHKTIHALDAF